MTVAATTRRAGPFIGNGITTAFPFTFKVFATSDVVVTMVDTTTLVETVLTEVTDYTVALNGDQDNNPGGTVNKLSVLASGKNLVLTSNVPQTQSAVLTNGGGFFPSVFNTLLDKLTVLVQQNSEVLGRALTVQKSSGLAGSSVAALAGGVLRWKADATGVYTEDFAAFCSDVGVAVNPSTYATAIATAEAYADTNKLAKASNLSDLANVATALTNLGGTTIGKAVFAAASNAAALLAMGVTFGTGPNNAVQLNGSSQLPPVDGSLLTGLAYGPNATIQMFGDASDGNVTVNGAVSLSRDMYYSNLTIVAGAALNTNGWRIFAAGTLDLTAAPAGSIFNNGGNGTTATGNGAFAGGAAAPGNTVGAGAAGVASTAGSGTATGRPANAGLTANNGGVGGAGGAGAQQAGGVGGATAAGGTTTPTAIHRAVTALTPSDFSTTPLLGGASGASGGGGAGDGSTAPGYSGGGSGAGGGVVYIAARIINRGVSTPASCIQAKGGSGGSGGNGAGVGGGGGAGGGGGGWVYIICNSLIGTSAANAVDVTGGNGGAGGTNAVTNGSDGGGTGAGGRFTLGVYSTSTMTDTLSGAAAKAPSAHTGTTPGGAQTANVAQFSL